MSLMGVVGYSGCLWVFGVLRYFMYEFNIVHFSCRNYYYMNYVFISAMLCTWLG